ncbi:ABC transporter permease [Clostridium brassicae]|uniref:ABC transporter permease n=1 Tax=Clostridium brassicae TaxID=2999072 RepID=A0ABT4DEB9_9CLOT|nr:ABC transporter permease [Clostridium brassicae]MCY6960669.1 ABC transporter permease [Clostridium brassicae]
MTLFNMAIKNVKRNFYNYFIYFTSMVFSILIYFTFTSIQYNQQILDLADEIGKVASGFKAASVVIAIFVAIFIWYSNSFFTRKRKKEIGLYSLMGVKKREIGRMLFYENIAMGALALLAGIFLGSLLSKVFIMLLLKLMGISIEVKFAIVPKAIINTCITFGILFLITSIHGYTIIYRFKLIDLFKAESTREKEPKASAILAILSMIFIIGGYKIYLDMFDERLNLGFGTRILLTLVLVVIGTYFFFSSFVVFVVKLRKKNKKHFYNGINMIGISQLSHRIKGNSRTLATIAVLSATTLTAMGVTASFAYDLKVNNKIKYPFSYVNDLTNKEVDKKIENIMAKYPKNKLLGSVDVNLLRFKGDLPNVFRNIQFAVDKDVNIDVISQSNFNETAKLRGLDYKFTLNNPNEIVLFDESHSNKIMDSYTGQTLKLKLPTGNKNFKIIDFKSYPLLSQYMSRITIVVQDNVYKEVFNNKNIHKVKAYMNANEEDSEQLTEELMNFADKSLKPLTKDPMMWHFSSYYIMYKSGLVTSGLLMFTAGFLGLVFLLATGSIIFFKQLSEANDDKERYSLLKKIGVNKKEIKNSISKQLLFVFLLPLILGIIHSLVAVSILGDALNLDLTIPLGISVGAYALIYMVYYLITVSSYNKTVNSKI